MKSIFRYVLRAVVVLLAVVLVLPIVLLVWWVFDPALNCLDDGGVWDGDLKKCRRDCLSWNEKDGCVEFAEEMK